jgi:hypothetical protein
MRNNTPPAPRGTFPAAPEPDGHRIAPNHVFAGPLTGAVQLRAIRELIWVVADLERRLRALEGEDAHGTRG